MTHLYDCHWFPSRFTTFICVGPSRMAMSVATWSSVFLKHPCWSLCVNMPICLKFRIKSSQCRSPARQNTVKAASMISTSEDNLAKAAAVPPFQITLWQLFSLRISYLVLCFIWILHDSFLFQFLTPFITSLLLPIRSGTLPGADGSNVWKYSRLAWPLYML